MIGAVRTPSRGFHRRPASLAVVVAVLLAGACTTGAKLATEPSAPPSPAASSSTPTTAPPTVEPGPLCRREPVRPGPQPTATALPPALQRVADEVQVLRALRFGDPVNPEPVSHERLVPGEDPAADEPILKHDWEASSKLGRGAYTNWPPVAFLMCMSISDVSISARNSGMTFESFFEAEHARLVAALYLLTGNSGEAEELMQEAFLRLWERWDRVGALESPTGYLFTTAYNLYRSAKRRLKRTALRMVRPPRDEIAEVEERAVVVAALSTLPPRQREALILAEFLDYRSEDIGKLMGISAGTARVLASQARTALRSRLGDLL